MPSLLLVVLVLQLVIHIVNTVGAPAIAEFLWVAYNRLPISTSHDVKTEIALRREVVKLKQELNATSSQDEFAKWARLRRNHDKKMAEYDEIANKSKATKSTFDRNANFIRFLSTNGLRFFLQFYYTKHPMYWIPRGWVPSYVEWVLAFPRAPMGSVSIQIWGIACATVIQIVGAAVVSALVLIQGQVGRTSRQSTASVPAEAHGGNKQNKKEL